MHRLSTVLRATLISAAAVGLFATPRAAAQTYKLTEFDTSGDAVGRAYGLNTNGQIVGSKDVGGTRHSAHWLHDVYTDLHGTVHFDLEHPFPLFNADYSESFSISDAGQIVGTARTTIRCEIEFIISNAYVMRPAVLSDIATPFPGDALTNLGTLGHPCSAHDSAAVGISNANHVVGWADVDSGGTVHAFLVTPQNGVWYQDVVDPNGLVNDLMIDLGTFDAYSTVSSATAVNDNGVVTGYSFIDPASTANGRAAYHAFRVVPAGNAWFLDDGAGGNALMEDLGTLGGTNSWGRGINNAGQVVGESGTADGNTHAFLWQNGVMIDLGTLGGENSSASRINDNGDVAGWAEVEGGERHAVVWINGQIRDLNSSLLPTTTPKTVLAEARDINENGVVAGWGALKSGTTRVDAAFMTRIATAAEIAEAEAIIAAQVDTGDSAGSTGEPGSVTNSGLGGGSFGGVPLVNSDAAVANSSIGSDAGDGAGANGETVTAPVMCGLGGVAMLPLTVFGMCLMRRRR